MSTTAGSVGIRQGVPASAGLSPAFTSAQKACAHIMPQPKNSRSRGNGPSKQVLLAFARCLRSHGVNGFPDPNAAGQLSTEMISAAGVNIHTPSFLNAAKSCVGVTHGAITVAQVEALINRQH